eukprot:IDg16731t1
MISCFFRYGRNKFQDNVLMDIMHTDREPVLNIVDEGTKFSTAKFVLDVSAKTIRLTILEFWTLIYTGLPHKMLVDRGAYFCSSFATLAAIFNVELQRTRTEAHSILGLGWDQKNSYRLHWFSAMAQIMAKLRINMALQHSVPVVADSFFSSGDQVMVWRNKQVNNCIAQVMKYFTLAEASNSFFCEIHQCPYVCIQSPVAQNKNSAIIDDQTVIKYYPNLDAMSQ